MAPGVGRPAHPGSGVADPTGVRATGPGTTGTTAVGPRDAVPGTGVTVVRGRIGRAAGATGRGLRQPTAPEAAATRPVRRPGRPGTGRVPRPPPGAPRATGGTGDPAVSGRRDRGRTVAAEWAGRAGTRSRSVTVTVTGVARGRATGDGPGRPLGTGATGGPVASGPAVVATRPPVPGPGRIAAHPSAGRTRSAVSDVRRATGPGERGATPATPVPAVPRAPRDGTGATGVRRTTGVPGRTVTAHRTTARRTTARRTTARRRRHRAPTCPSGPTRGTWTRASVPPSVGWTPATPRRWPVTS